MSDKKAIVELLTKSIKDMETLRPSVDILALEFFDLVTVSIALAFSLIEESRQVIIKKCPFCSVNLSVASLDLSFIESSVGSRIYLCGNGCLAFSCDPENIDSRLKAFERPEL